MTDATQQNGVEDGEQAQQVPKMYIVKLSNGSKKMIARTVDDVAVAVSEHGFVTVEECEVIQ